MRENSKVWLSHMKKAREKIQCGFIRKILLNIQCQPSDENAEKTVEALDIYHRHSQGNI